MAKFIGSELTTGNFGEDTFCQALIAAFPDDYIIYRNRQVFGREFDVAMLIPNVGIAVFEVKGWRESTVLRVENGDSIVINVNGQEEHAAPQRQVRGYRFAIERRLQQDLGAKPIVFGMVVYPQITEAFYKAKSLSAITESQFTVLKDDLATTTALQTKLAQAVNEVQMWRRRKFDDEFMYNTRCLFEGDIAHATNNPEIIEGIKKFPQPAYSIFIYQPAGEPIDAQELSQLADSYNKGTKLYAVVGDDAQLQQIIALVDNVLQKKSLRRHKNNLEVQYEASQVPYPPAANINNIFSAFNCSASVLSHPVSVKPFRVINGVEEDHHNDLVELSNASSFNYDQFEVEHIPVERNILIRAGAGTGKTFTMISRIGFIAYSLAGTLLDLLDRVTMITFTNEAADQMRKKLKTFFQNYYLITGNILWLSLVCNIDRMQISTIDSYAKKLIDSLGIEFGYGCDIGITSSAYNRQQYVAKLVNEYIVKKTSKSLNYVSRLGMPMYQLVSVIVGFIEKLQSKNVDVATLSAAHFGDLTDGTGTQELHELLSYIIPKVESEYQLQLIKDNKVHLNSMMSILQLLINDPAAQRRIITLKQPSSMYMFVDEFQDTDNTQIDILVKLSAMLGARLFVVGDVKQCIYRFRGATEEAFARLPGNFDWKECALKRNYRTDAALLEIFDKSFAIWGAPANKHLEYIRSQDQLIGTKNYNSHHPASQYYKEIRIATDDGRMEALLDEVQRIQNWIDTDIRNGVKLSDEERTIAILVRENWQAEAVKAAAATRNLQIKTNTGGDLYQTPAAIDMLTLVNALLHYDEPTYLFSLLASSFFSVDVPYSELYKVRQEANDADLWEPGAGREYMRNHLTKCIDKGLDKMPGDRNTWAKIITALRTEPVLQVLNQIYDILKPEVACAKGNEWERKCYKMNVDLLFEQVLASTNTDNLTINSFAKSLNICIMSAVSVNSRVPAEKDTPSIQCITVHKAKGLEYGHVIIPYASFPVDRLKRAKLNVSVAESQDGVQIGYSVERPDNRQTQTNTYYSEQAEIAERYREETRILYVAMTRAIRSFSWIFQEDRACDSWQTMIEPEED